MQQGSGPVIEDRTTVRPVHREIWHRRSGRVNPSALDDQRTSVEIWDDRFRLPLWLYFEHNGQGAPLVGIEVGSESHADTPLDPTQLMHVTKNLPMYVAYARAEIALDADPSQTGLLVEALNEAGTTRRGKPGRFFRVIGEEYAARVGEGDSAPVTSIAAAHGVVLSTASRWVKEARRRGYIDAEDGT